MVSKKNNRHAQQNRKHPLPTPREIRCKFAYRPHTGEIVTKSGVVGSVRQYGYHVVVYRKNVVLNSHQVAFVLMRGYWPELINHINGDRSDNRWENLEEVSHGQNVILGRINRPLHWNIVKRQNTYSVSFKRDGRLIQANFTLWRDAYRFNAKLCEGIRQHGAGFTLPVPPKSERIKPHMRPVLRKTES